MRPIYVNTRTSIGRETVDAVDPSPEYWPTARELGDRATVVEMDNAESLNVRRAMADNAQAPAI